MGGSGSATSRRVEPTRRLPLDYATRDYSYLERPNTVLLQLMKKYALARRSGARILDVGCGAGANARALLELQPETRITGIEPNARAAELARQVCGEVFVGLVDDWMKQAPEQPFDAVVLSDVLEHIVEPIRLLRSLSQVEALRDATWVLSIPNYAVWYNRARTLLGNFEYSWSGLYDRTHLRFFTRRSLRQVLEYCGFEVLEDRCSPSLVQSAAPLIRKVFERDVDGGNHLTLTQSPSYKAYESFIEPVETRLCQLWPELLGFQIVCAARLKPKRV